MDFDTWVKTPFSEDDKIILTDILKSYGLIITDFTFYEVKSIRAEFINQELTDEEKYNFANNGFYELMETEFPNWKRTYIIDKMLKNNQ